MRPLELAVEGFKSYGDEQAFCFDGRSLFGIVGPTGAGKSTILEGVIFALYGKTPQIQKDTKKLIHSGAEEARVRLVFEVDDALWEVSRAIRRKGSSQVALRNVGAPGAEASGEGNVNDRIVELLALDFNAFCSSVMLPQGEFDRFLRATPAERSRILKGVFRLERVDLLREAAKARASHLQGGLLALRNELEGLPADPARLDGLGQELVRASELAQAMGRAVADAIHAERERGQAAERLDEIDRRIAEVARALDSIPGAAELGELAGEESSRRIAAEAAEAEAAGARAALAQAREGLESLLGALGGEERLLRARELALERSRLQGRVGSLSVERDQQASAAQEAEGAVQRLVELVEEAEAACEGARAEVDSLRRRHAAHLLRMDLASGEPCPVCERIVEAVPAPGGAPGLDPAEKEAARQEAAVRTGRARLEEARRGLALVLDRRRAACAELDRTAAELAEAEQALAGLLGEEVADALVVIEERQAGLRAARAAVDAQRGAVDEAESGVAGARRELEAVAAGRRRYAAALIQVCGILRVPPPGIEADAAELTLAAERAAAQAVALIEAEQERRARIGEAVAAAQEQLGSLRARFDLPPDAAVAEALERATAQANARVGGLEQEIRRVEEAIARAREVADEMAAASEEKDRYDRLAQDLTDHRFIAFLLDGQRRLLSRLASEKLFELTHRYRFDEEGGFEIVDVRTEAKRTSDTLSGGETFLASLALALGLAEAVSQRGGRLDCFFLDEGFGSLDAESLDLALEGIENLALPGRLIGLISHVGGIQARLDDLTVLDRGPDGCTVVVQADGPISYPGSSI